MTQNTTSTDSNDLFDSLDFLRPDWEPAWLADFGKSRTSSTKCEDGDLTHPVALVLQAVLGFLAFSVLLLKRQCEPAQERRNWMVWFLDTNKQGISMVAMHFMNIFLAESGQKARNSDPCTYYLFSFALDSSIGLVIIWVGLKCAEWLIQKFKILGGHNFGDYDMSPRWDYRGPRPKNRNNCNNTVEIGINANSIVCDDFDSLSQNSQDNMIKREINNTNSFINTTTSSTNSSNQNNNNGNIINNRTGNHQRCLPKMPFSLSIWSLQTVAYLLVTVIEKVVVFKLLAIDSLEVVFHDLRILMTAWFKNKYIEILIVLFIIPLILNIFMFWVVDNILMQSQGCLYVIFDWIKKLPKLLFCKCFGGGGCWKTKNSSKNKDRRKDNLPSDEEGIPVLAKNSENEVNHVISSNANTNRNNNSESICDMSPVFSSRVKRISASIDTACDSVRTLVENALSSQNEQHTRLPSEMETEENVISFEAEVPKIL